MTPHHTMHMYDDGSLRAQVPAAQTARRMPAHGSCIRRLVGDDLAQDLIEYALLLALIALAVISGLQSLGIAVNGQYGAASTAIAGAAAPDSDGGNGGGNPGNPDPGDGTPSNGNPGTGNPGNGTGSGGE
jgi:Flp pilus assembly pilin Flp